MQCHGIPNLVQRKDEQLASFRASEIRPARGKVDRGRTRIPSVAVGPRLMIRRSQPHSAEQKTKLPIEISPLGEVSGSRTAGRIIDVQSGPLQVRLAESDADIDAAQALRYRIFYESLGAQPLPELARRRRDADRFDDGCDHLLVLDHSRGIDADAVIGTYRLIRRDTAAHLGGFYSASEFDISPLVIHPGEILELGRSCVDPAYRQRGAMQLLWSGIAAYVFHYNICLMFGCASLPGTDPDALAMPLSYLHHHHRAPPALRPRARSERYVDMCRLDRCAVNSMQAVAALPPLIKGYLRLGGFVGDGAVIDEQFNTTDVCILVKTDLVAEKYSRHYERQSKETWTA
jgi:L-ornithine Nalpha-acyltransferase